MTRQDIDEADLWQRQHGDGGSWDNAPDTVRHTIIIVAVARRSNMGVWERIAPEWE